MLEVNFEYVRKAFDESFPELSNKDYVEIIENGSDEQIIDMIKWFKNQGKFSKLEYKSDNQYEILLSDYNFSYVFNEIKLFTALALPPERYDNIISKV
jgi:hypothetical protein